MNLEAGKQPFEGDGLALGRMLVARDELSWCQTAEITRFSPCRLCHFGVRMSLRPIQIDVWRIARPSLWLREQGGPFWELPRCTSERAKFGNRIVQINRLSTVTAVHHVVDSPRGTRCALRAA